MEAYGLAELLGTLSSEIPYELRLETSSCGQINWNPGRKRWMKIEAEIERMGDHASTSITYLAGEVIFLASVLAGRNSTNYDKDIIDWLSIVRQQLIALPLGDQLLRAQAELFPRLLSKCPFTLEVQRIISRRRTGTPWSVDYSTLPVFSRSSLSPTVRKNWNGCFESNQQWSIATRKEVVVDTPIPMTAARSSQIRIPLADLFPKEENSVRW